MIVLINTRFNIHLGRLKGISVLFGRELTSIVEKLRLNIINCDIISIHVLLLDYHLSLEYEKNFPRVNA